MDFIFQGFQSILPVWLFLLLFAGTTFLAWWSYRSVLTLKSIHFYLLFLLRSVAFFILLLLLLNPLFKTESTYTEPPTLLVMMDNSASTSLQQGSYEGIKSYKSVLSELDFQGNTAQSYQYFSVGNEVTSSSIDSLTFDADQTDLSASIETIRDRELAVDAAILISDGIYTRGQNPVFEAQDLSLPIFTIAIGDTARNKDVLVSSVTTNPVGYLNTQHAVSATVASNGYAGESFAVRLQKGDEVISAQTVSPETSNSLTKVTFDLLLETEGLQQYQVVIPELSNEWTAANNQQLFSIDVQDAKQKILSLAFEIHPDVKFIRTLLSQDQNIELSTRTWIKGDRFLEGELTLDPDSIDLAVIHGFPSTGLSANIITSVSRLAEQTPLIIAATPNLDVPNFNQNVASLPVTSSAQWNFSPVSLAPELSTPEHSIMELPAISYSQLPSIFAPIQNVALAPGASLIFKSNFQGEATDTPVLAVQELGNKRIAVFTGYGWYRLNQSIRGDQKDFIGQLWLNTVSWTVSDPDDKLLEVNPEKPSFSESEPVILNAHLSNERGETESEAAIEVSLTSDSLNERFYSMENVGAGQYQLKAGSMPEGIYSFEAIAKKGDRALDTRSGEFTVARSNAEFLNTQRDDHLLRQLASRTGGSYLPYDSVSVFWDRLNKTNILEPNTEVQTNFIFPNRHIGWFVIVVLILGIEWGYRKYLSLP